jgi:predicted RNA binding protein YcfA (HicA-like mRNA interferase family)
MPRLIPRSSREVEALLRHLGFRLDRPGKGHDIWARDADGRCVSLPRDRPSGGIPVGTLKFILIQAGISRQDALSFWGRSKR